MECCIYVLLSIMFIEKLLVCYCVVFMFIEKLNIVLYLVRDEWVYFDCSKVVPWWGVRFK
ncbi:hypothetical protein H5410_039878 [Solanum commersonii]|uniref:Uncharacterized protein n=1 Tax=Solanum commersonii TaxID=4109 RepID=A0A9J5XPT5_SOLCO|nr:hypothetical protein H5410_039878 [Solanum commersonii]